MYYVGIKYQNRELPVEYAFEKKEKAEEYADWKAKFKPYVEWAKVYRNRKYPNEDLRSK